MAWLIIALLIAVNALYVAAEFATVAVRRTQIQQRAEQGNRPARLLLPYLNDAQALDRYIAACQIGITLSSLVLGAYGQVTFTGQLAGFLEGLADLEAFTAVAWAATIVLIGLTICQMILGELVPKSLALQYPVQLALWTALPMQWSLRLLSWFIVVLNGSGAFVLRLFGMSGEGHHHLHSPEELELLLAESRAGGLLQPDEHRRLRRALQLGRRSVREIMVPRTQMRVVDLREPPARIRAEVASSPFTRLPVVDGSIDEVTGMLHARDLAVAAARDGDSLDVRGCLRPVLVVPETTPVDRLLIRFREERQQVAIVLDEYGGTAGMVTIADVLEELVGSVGAATPGRPGPDRLPDGRIRLPGDLRFDETVEWLGDDADLLGHGRTGDSVTVGGRVLEAIGHLPEPGTRVTIEGLEIEVERVAHHAIVSVLVRQRSHSEQST